MAVLCCRLLFFRILQAHFPRVHTCRRFVGSNLVLTSTKMPPKRKAAEKASSVMAQEQEVAEEPVKRGRGKKAPAKAEAEATETKPKRGRQAKAKPVVEEHDEDEDDGDVELKQANGNNVDSNEEDEAEPEVKEPKPSKAKAGRARGRPAKAAKKENKKAKEQEKHEEEDEEADEKDSEEEEEEEEKPQARKGRKPAAASNGEPKEKKTKTETKPKAKGTKPKVNETSTDIGTIDFSCAKKNGKEQMSNFKIMSWNIDGIRAWVKKDPFEYLTKEDADIICLQETKCSEDQVPTEVLDLKEYKKYWVGSDKAGYAGVAILSKEEPLSVTYGIKDEKQDEDGRCITVEYKNFYLINVYVPNAGRKLVTLPKRMEWNEKFKAFVLDLDKKKPVIVCGDMNVAHEEIDLANPKTNKKNAGFTQEEREGMTDFLGSGFVDSFRKFYPDQADAYTFWTYLNRARPKNVGWRLDYFIVSERFMDSICDNIIRNSVMGSDHCPITLFLNI